MSIVDISEVQADFAVKLLQQSAQANQDASVIISPVSIAVSLSMIYAGAKKETKTQIAKLLANGASDEKIHSHFSAVVQQLSDDSKSYTLETANRVYVQEGFPVLQSFKSTIGRYYEGQFQQLDLKKKAKAAKEINGFVEEKTHGKIKDSFPADAVYNSTPLVLVNAIYFKGTWENKFDKNLTGMKTFYVAEGNEKKVEMMYMSTQFDYFEDDDAQVLGLPYVGNELCMFIILPRERFGLQKLLDSLSGKKLAEYVGEHGKRKVAAYLPRFKVETSLNLKETLSNLGMSIAFTARDANFGGISRNGPLWIGEAVHMAFVEVGPIVEAVPLSSPVVLEY
ncbi:SRPN-1 protein [Aphelenchoides avenae]|nr:SRPN-1 protein [Aphelenchus avenae]